MSAFKRFKEKAKAQGMGLYQQVQAEAQQFAQARQSNAGQQQQQEQSYQQYSGPPPQGTSASPNLFSAGNPGTAYAYGGHENHPTHNSPQQQQGYYYHGHSPPAPGQPQAQQHQSGWQHGQSNSAGVGHYGYSQPLTGPHDPFPPPPPPQPASYPQPHRQPSQQYPPPPSQQFSTPQAPPSRTIPSANEPLIQVATFNAPPPPPIQLRQQGEPNAVIWECPGPSRVVDYPTTWNHLPEVPDFLICTRCYERHIASTHHAASFPRTANEIEGGTCRFNVPRVVDSVWPAACRTGNLGPLKEYAIKRLRIPACPGAGGAHGETRWYEGAIGGPAGLRICEACIEEHVNGTPFRGYFQQADAHGGHECHLHHSYLTRAMAVCSKNPGSTSGWSQFTAAARLRLSRPSCDGTPAAADSRTWRRPKNPALSNTGLIFCEACFLDQVGATPFADEFEVVPLQSHNTLSSPSSATRFINKLLPGNQNKYTCQAQIPSVLILLDTSKVLQDFSLFVTHVPTILSSSTPRCTEAGISNATWAEARSNPSFNICHACYAGIIAPYGTALGSLFRFSSSPFFGVRLCSLHPTNLNPPFLQSMHALQRVLDTGLLSAFTSYLVSTNTVQPSSSATTPFSATATTNPQISPDCPRSTLVPNLRWYGYQDCGICPQCYASVCAGTILAPKMPIQNALVTGPTMCSMYSPRMRSLYAQACAKNDPSELIEYAHTRALAHANTLLKAEAMRQIRDIKMMGAVHQGTTVAAMYRGGQSFALAAGAGWDGHVYGNSGTLGWHPTQSGALAAQAGENMRVGMADAMGQGGEIAELERRWLDFE